MRRLRFTPAQMRCAGAGVWDSGKFATLPKPRRRSPRRQPYFRSAMRRSTMPASAVLKQRAERTSPNPAAAAST